MSAKFPRGGGANPFSAIRLCTLSTNFVLLCTLYYLLQDIDIFSDYSFLLEVTVLFLKSKKKQTNFDKAHQIDY